MRARAELLPKHPKWDNAPIWPERLAYEVNAALDRDACVLDELDTGGTPCRRQPGRCSERMCIELVANGCHRLSNLAPRNQRSEVLLRIRPQRVKNRCIDGSR